jgi:hypothetical protein
VRTCVGIERERNVVIDTITIIIKHILYCNNFNPEEDKRPIRFEKGFALTALKLILTQKSN